MAGEVSDGDLSALRVCADRGGFIRMGDVDASL